MERNFSRDVDSLDAVFDFLAGFLSDSGAPDTGTEHLALIVEELFVNAVRHSPQGRDVSLGLEREGDSIVIRLTDRGVEPFDILQTPDVDTRLTLDERRRGGLGLHLVRRLSDSLACEHSGGDTTITVRAPLEAKHV